MSVSSLPRPRLRTRLSDALAGARGTALAFLLAAGFPTAGALAAGGAALAVLLGHAAAPASGAETSVSDAAGLAAALAAARPGTRILLQDGDYGDFATAARPSGPVTIAARTPLGARFGKLDLSGAANLTVEGVQTEDFRANKARAIAGERLKSKVFYFRDVAGLRLEDSEGAGGWHILILNSVTDFVIRGNRLHDAREDILRITGPSARGLVEGNQLYETHAKRPAHPDLIQLFNVKEESPREIVIRGNLLWDDPATGEIPPQGIFLGGPGAGFRDITIEENLIATGHTNTLYVNGGQANVVIRGNMLMSVTGTRMPDAILRIAAKSGLDNAGITATGNVVRDIYDETKTSRLAGNFAYGKAERQRVLFAGPGVGRRWQDFVPVAGSPIDFGSPYGAQTLLKGLLAAQKP